VSISLTISALGFWTVLQIEAKNRGVTPESSVARARIETHMTPMHLIPTCYVIGYSLSCALIL
jgi:hypothetical protein